MLESWIENSILELQSLMMKVQFLGVGWQHGTGKVVSGTKTQQHGNRRPRTELKEKSQIVKERMKRAAKQAYQQHRTEQRWKRKGPKPNFRRKH